MKLDLRFPRLHDIEEYGASGRLLGYASVINNVSEALSMAGVEFTEESPVALQITPPFLFKPVRGKVNVAMSMWETREFIPENRPVFDADVIIVPSSFCRSVFKRAGYRGPIVVVPLGIWAEHWAVGRDERPGDTVRRFLWVGAPDPRKGIDLLKRLWDFAVDDPCVHLTIKTTVEPGVPSVGTHQLPGVTFIANRLRWADMWALYCAHDVFLFPTLAEGFGLPALEAMAAGLLLIAPVHSGLRDFVNRRVAWCVDTTKVRGYYGTDVVLAAPKLSHMRALMHAAVEDYAMTTELRQRATTHAHTFTWNRTAEGVLAAIRRYAGRAVT